MDRPIKILMLEDDVDDVDLIKYVLRTEGVTFEEKSVDSPEDFQDALGNFNPDVILSDHSLPRFNSMEALQICRKLKVSAPFILVTGAVSEEFAVSCLKQGADDYVLKSNLVRLPSAIANSLKQKNADSRRKKAEQRILRQNEELTKVNKELDSIVYSISHNLRAPLASVLGLINISRVDDTERDGFFSPTFSLMERAVKKLDTTLKEILDYSRNARGRILKEEINFHGLIDEGIEKLQFIEGNDLIKKNITVTDGEVPFISDSYRLKVILDNLLSNSVKYRDTRKAEPFISIRVSANAEKAVMIFEDNGIGIPEDLKARIFEMFFRATEKSEGAGLGLYLVKEAVEKLGGKIQVTSSLGEGTRFQLEIPNLRN